MVVILTFTGCSGADGVNQRAPAGITEDEEVGQGGEEGEAHPARTDTPLPSVTQTPPDFTETPVPAVTETLEEDGATQVSVPTDFPEPWMNMPVVPEISDRVREIYHEGQARGRNPQAFSKIGDCQNVTDYYLSVFENSDSYTLGEEFQYLQPTIDHYQGSFGRESLAVEGGFNVAAVLSPFRADQKQCSPQWSPLTCEIRRHNPSLVIISFEEWWGKKSAETYAGYMRTVVEQTIARDVVPILTTKADNLEGDHSINKAIVDIAREYEIPLWNFWRAAHVLPDHGLKEDGFHLTYKHHCNHFDDPLCMEHAWTWRNLTALQTLHAFRQAVAGENVQGK